MPLSGQFVSVLIDQVAVGVAVIGVSGGFGVVITVVSRFLPLVGHNPTDVGAFHGVKRRVRGARWPRLISCRLPQRSWRGHRAPGT